MIKEITGDLLRDGQGILCHQVNFHGIMGGGIALSIANNLLTPKQYRQYQDFCRQLGKGALGHVLCMDCADGRTVANMFSQTDYSVDTHMTGAFTDYAAMQKCFVRIQERARRFHQPVSIPGYIGCGIAGGNWSCVRNIIEVLFADSPVDTTIIYWERDEAMMHRESKLYR